MKIAPKRKTPTERQIEALRGLDTDQLTNKALQAMQALNRRAKAKRDNRNEYRRATFAKALEREIEEIYSVKDAFLDALVLAGRAKLCTFSVESTAPETYCHACDRTWFGGGECYGCGCEGEVLPDRNQWFVVEASGYRFHQPSMCDAAAALAKAIPPHNPEQPAREIPEIVIETASGKVAKLTISAQMECVRMATAELQQATKGRVASA